MPQILFKFSLNSSLPLHNKMLNHSPLPLNSEQLNYLTDVLEAPLIIDTPPDGFLTFTVTFDGRYLISFTLRTPRSVQTSSFGSQVPL